MAQEAGDYIDVKTAFGSIISRHNTDDDWKAHFNARAIISSAFEHGILEQLMGSDNPCISTMKLFQIANSEGSKVFFANSGNFATVKPQLHNYSASTLNDLQFQVNSGHTLILPDDGQLGMGQWQGLGYITRYESGSSMSLGMIIGGGYHGGYGSNPAQADPPAVNQNIQTNTNNNPAPSTINQQVTPHSTPQSIESVDMAGGSYLYNRIDLALGGTSSLGPAFGRSYNSGLNLEDRGLGNGWTHNYDIRISRGSHGDPGLGGRQPVDSAAMIIALYINLDLMKNQDDIQGWMVASLTNKWAVDQLIDNAITIHLGSKVMEYIKLADDLYASPPGITTQLMDSGDNTFSLRERFGTCLDFNTDDRITRLTDVDNNTMTFTCS
ncbi:MAG: hypothetical protein C4B58_08210 [Deltaproteobacteria bacterium]|nr:MAG: hypothetical protein C4B58_08210 [Deltaproteobacteria bacterium]